MTSLWLLATAAQLAALLSARALSRRERSHRPVTIALLVLTAASLVRKARLEWLVPPARKLLDDPPPYEGWQRVAFHAIEQAGELLTPAMVAWASVRVFTSWSIEGIRWAYMSLLIWAAFCYPTLRGAHLATVYLGAHVAALLVALAAVVARLRRGHLRELTTTEGCTLMIVGFQVLDLAVGAWRYGLYGETYRATQGGLLALYLLLAFAQLRALVRTRPA